MLTESITVPEGLRLPQIAGRIAGIAGHDSAAIAGLLAGVDAPTRWSLPGPTLEGYLFPDTYSLRDDLTPTEMIARMVASFRRRTNALMMEHATGATRLRDDLGFELDEIVALASVVEKEAAVADERPIIAGVFINRLRSPDFRPRRLQADPTVSYGCRTAPERAPSCAGFDGRRITRAMLNDRQNPYNTYRHEGLPPGPICNPGLASLRAVLTAEPHDYLYFVARGGGRHTFSATLEEHNAAVQRYRARAPR